MLSASLHFLLWQCFGAAGRNAGRDALPAREGLEERGGRGWDGACECLGKDGGAVGNAEALALGDGVVGGCDGIGADAAFGDGCAAPFLLPCSQARNTARGVGSVAIAPVLGATAGTAAKHWFKS